MKLVDLTCTKCGATLQINKELDQCMCQYCGNVMAIDHETPQIDAFKFGYEAEKGRQQYLKDSAMEIEARNADIIIERKKALKDMIDSVGKVGEYKKKYDWNRYRYALITSPIKWSLICGLAGIIVGPVAASVLIAIVCSITGAETPSTIPNSVVSISMILGIIGCAVLVFLWSKFDSRNAESVSAELQKYTKLYNDERNKVTKFQEAYIPRQYRYMVAYRRMYSYFERGLVDNYPDAVRMYEKERQQQAAQNKKKRR